jgi:hypothetical protein
MSKLFFSLSYTPLISGNTYDNECSAQASRVSIVSYGSCDNGNRDVQCTVGDSTCKSDEYCKAAEGTCGGDGRCTVKPTICQLNYVPGEFLADDCYNNNITSTFYSNRPSHYITT